MILQSQELHDLTPIIISLQLSFRSVATSIQTKQDQIRRILQLPPPPTAGTPRSEVDPAAQDLEDAMNAYLRRAVENFDLSKNVEVRDS